MGRDSRRRRTRIAELPDDLLELILLRVPTPVCLFRAAATCALCRRVIAGDDGFLQRVRAHRRPTNHILGHYSVTRTMKRGLSRTVTEFVPFPERPAVDLCQRLSLDFLVDVDYKNKCPELTDSRGGLLAFVLHNTWYAVLCDPWTRKYTELQFPWKRMCSLCSYECLGAFIIDAGEGDGDGDEKSSLMSSFSVLCACLITDKTDGTTAAEAWVFSARDNAWIRGTVSRDVCTDVADMMHMDQRFLGRAGGSIFFSGIETMDTWHVLLVLDEATGEFSTITLPLPPDDPKNDNLAGDRKDIRVINGDAVSGTLARIVCLAKDDLEVLKLTRDQHGGWECTVEKSFHLCQLANVEPTPLWVNGPWRFLDTTMMAAPTLVLFAYTLSPTLLFSLDLQTMELRRADKMTTTLKANQEYRVFPYQLPWPQKINQCHLVM